MSSSRNGFTVWPCCEQRRAQRVVQRFHPPAVAAAYWWGAYFVAVFTGGIGARWAHQLQQLAGWPAHAAPIVLSLMGALGLLIIATPLAGILTALYSRHAAAGALLVATATTASLLYDSYILCQTGLQIPTSALELIGFDTIKTLLVPLLLTLAAQHWLPSRL